MERNKKKLPFGTPKGYFESLPQKINSRVVKPGTGFNQAFFTTKKMVWTGLACTILIVFVYISVLPNYKNSNKENEISLVLNEMPQEEIKAYLLAEGFTEGELLEVLEENQSTEDILPAIPTLDTEDLDDILDAQDIEILF